MRSLAASIAVCALACAGLAQTGSELEAKFGRFDGKGYSVTPDVRLTVTYGEDHSACRLELRSKTAVSTDSSLQRHDFESDVADRVLNAIAPSAVRKGIPRKILMQSGCSAIAIDEYDNVGIVRVTNECSGLSKNNVASLIIHWKRAACDSVRQ